MKKMRIYLTGGRGMVGRNFIEHINACEHEIYAPTSQDIDLRNYDAVYKSIVEFKPDIVLHCAGKVGGIQANIREPVRFLLDNLDMGRNILWASYKAGVQKLLNMGSSCMYPRDAVNPLCEKNILKGELEPTNEGYALAKATTARFCEYIGREHADFSYKTLVPCNIYGRYDKFDPKNSHMIPAIICKLHNANIKSEDTVDIWGDGLAKREFMYAGDLADCMWRCIEHFEAMPQNMNAGLGFDYTVNEYYRVAAKIVGFSGKFTHDLTKPVGMQQKLVSIELLKAWGWQAKTTLHDGLKQTYSYYLKEVVQ